MTWLSLNFKPSVYSCWLLCVKWKCFKYSMSYPILQYKFTRTQQHKDLYTKDIKQNAQVYKFVAFWFRNRKRCYFLMQYNCLFLFLTGQENPWHLQLSHQTAQSFCCLLSNPVVKRQQGQQDYDPGRQRDHHTA